MIRIRTATSAKGLNDINESPIVLHPTLSSSGLLLSLLLFLDFRCLSLHFTGSGQWSVNFTTSESDADINIFSVSQFRADYLLFLIERTTTTVEDLFFSWNIFGAFDKNLIKDKNRKQKTIEVTISLRNDTKVV